MAKKSLTDYFRYDFLTGHVNLGSNITIYGRNAMKWGVTIYTKKYGYICFRLPLFCFGKWHPLYLYFSPNGTPWAATFMIGRKNRKEDWKLSRLRYFYLGHNFNPEPNKKTLNSINYFHPGNDSTILELLERSKAEIKALTKSLNKQSKNLTQYNNDMLLEDLKRHIEIFRGDNDDC